MHNGYIDGGVFANNPALVALIREARCLVRLGVAGDRGDRVPPVARLALLRTVGKKAMSIEERLENWLLREFLDRAEASSAGPALMGKDRVLHAKAALAVHRNQSQAAMAILRSNCFATYGSDRTQLSAQRQTTRGVRDRTSVMHFAK